MPLYKQNMPAGSLGLNSRHFTNVNRPTTLGSLLTNCTYGGAGNCNRVYKWYKQQNNLQPDDIFTTMTGVRRGMWPSSTPNNTYHPYYSAAMYYNRLPIQPSMALP